MKQLTQIFKRIVFHARNYNTFRSVAGDASVYSYAAQHRSISGGMESLLGKESQ